MSSSRRRRVVPAVLSVLVLAVVLVAGGIAHAETVRVRGVFDGGYVWRPKTRSIVVGTTVRWKAVEGNHNVQSRGSNWSYFRNLPEGTSVARDFNRRGTFRYYCTIHGTVQDGVCSGMCGRIVVG